MSNKNKATIKQIIVIQKNLLPHFSFRQFSKTNLITSIIQIWLGYELMRTWLKDADEYWSIDKVNDAIAEAYRKSHDGNEYQEE